MATGTKKKGKRIQIQPQDYDIDLPNGKKVQVQFVFGEDIVQRPVKVLMGIPFINFSHATFQGIKNYRNKDNKILRLDILVPSTQVTMTFPDGSKLMGRSCCKPPDQFNLADGKRLAMKHLFEQDKSKLLSHDDRATIMRRCVPQLFRWEDKRPGKDETSSKPPIVKGQVS